MSEAVIPTTASNYDTFPTTLHLHDNDWIFPLLLSCLAGASTCVGAAVVFCFSSQQIQRSMSFSLSLAASVMITVSVISIGPECLKGIVVLRENSDETILTTMMEYTIHTWLLLERLVCFGAGCVGYLLLSKLLGAMPDPEHLFLFGNNSSKNRNSNGNDLDHGLVDMSSIHDEGCVTWKHQPVLLDIHQS
jgi:zinc transporter ZupT